MLIDYLGGIEAARDEIARHADASISLITWMEVLAGASDDRETARLKSFLSSFELVAIDAEVSELAVAIRHRHRIRLPDAIIWASARSIGAVLVTRNTKDFTVKHFGEPERTNPVAAEGRENGGDCAWTVKASRPEGCPRCRLSSRSVGSRRCGRVVWFLGSQCTGVILAGGGQHTETAPSS